MTIRIASRSSKLALKQVEIFSKAFLLEDYKLVEVLTSGDKMSAKGEVMFDKANFVNEIEQMIQKNSVDIAIHSAKDMPAQETEGLQHFYFIETQKRKINDLIIFRNDTDTVFEKNIRGWEGDIPFYSYSTKKMNKMGYKFKLSSFSALKKTIKNLQKSKQIVKNVKHVVSGMSTTCQTIVENLKKYQNVLFLFFVFLKT